MPIDDLARSEVVTADSETPVTDLARTMADEDVGSIVIIDGDEPIGIVTDRDLTVRVLGEAIDPEEQTARDVMSEDLTTVEMGVGFYEAAALMADLGIRRLPVTDDGELVGIITADDLTELLADEEQHLAAIIRAQRPEY